MGFNMGPFDAGDIGQKGEFRTRLSLLLEMGPRPRLVQYADII